MNHSPEVVEMVRKAIWVSIGIMLDTQAVIAGLDAFVIRGEEVSWCKTHKLPQCEHCVVHPDKPHCAKPKGLAPCVMQERILIDR